MGEAKSGRGAAGSIKRQLDFYKLLLERWNLHSGKRLNLGEMTKGRIDFLEPDKKGKYKSEEFAVTESDVAALTSEIQRVGKEIYSLEFWDKRCNNRKCEFCRLRDTLN